MAKPPLNGPCRLCGTVADLHDSHVIPRWVYKRVVHRYGDTTVPVKVHNRVALQDARQASERLLCGCCEKRFKDREDHASDVSDHEDGTFVAYTTATSFHQYGDGEYFARAGPDLDTEALAYFGASVIWRASVSSLFPKVKLGPYEQPFGDYLVGRGPWPTDAAAVLRLIRRDDLDTDGILIAPESERIAGFHRHQFLFAGLQFQLSVGQKLPPGFDEISLRDNRTVLLTPATDLLLKVRAAALSAKRKGKLARG